MRELAHELLDTQDLCAMLLGCVIMKMHRH